MVGQTISRYRIMEKLGEGGMGVVYRAEDIKLKRSVALKFLAPHLLRDEEGRKRFLREAQAAAALDHPNICTVYEIDETEGQTFLSMAHLEGETVKKKIKVRPLKLDKALDIAIQTAKGLQAAHEKGIVHRDIKSANLMVAPHGQVKVMDFGLAQLSDRSQLTKTATILGTPAYMSPEQARREPTNNRTDIWSLGVVIYEMVTGRLPFQGERDEAVAYAIVHEAPEPMTAQRVDVPVDLDRIVSKALAKEPNERYQHVDEMIVDLRALEKTLVSAKSTTPPVGEQSLVQAEAQPEKRARQAEPAHPLVHYCVTGGPEAAGNGIVYSANDPQLRRRVMIRILPEETAHEIERKQRSRQRTLWAGVVVFGLAALVFALLWLREPGPAPQGNLRKFALPLGVPPGLPAISPNGRQVVYRTLGPTSRLWVQGLDSFQPRPLEGTEGTFLPSSISWSPDSQFIAFRVSKTLKKISWQGRALLTLWESQEPISGPTAWTPDGGSVVFAAGLPPRLYEVPAGGGKPRLLIEPQESEKELGFFDPYFLPPASGQSGVLFCLGGSSDSTIFVQDLETGKRRRLVQGFRPVFSPTGHILYTQTAAYGSADLWALPFSLQSLAPAGEAFLVATNARQHTVSDDGTLVYLDLGKPGRQTLIWCDRDGNDLGAIGQPQDAIRYPRLSPDARRVAVAGTENGNRDIWIHEVERPVKTRLTSEPAEKIFPTWSPSGNEIAFSPGTPADSWSSIYVQPSDGSGEATLLSETPGVNQHPTDWFSGNGILLYRYGRSRDLWYLRPNDDGSYEEVPFLQTSFSERTAVFSPDGRFVAYSSDESGRYEIYLCSFPGCRERRRVSLNGGSGPRWRRDGRELFYVQGDTLMAAPVSTDPRPTLGRPQKLFSAASLRVEDYNETPYDVTPDGRRFVLWAPIEEDTSQSIRVVQNWYEEFHDRER